MSIEGQGHFFTIYFPGFVCFVLYKATISGERLQDRWSSGFIFFPGKFAAVKRFLTNLLCTLNFRTEIIQGDITRYVSWLPW